MPSKSKISEISALHQKKYRQSTGLFIAEGEKIVEEIAASEWEIVEAYATSALYEKFVGVIPTLECVEAAVFAKISALKTPSGLLAVVKQKHFLAEQAALQNRFTLCIDGVRDPGNLGTIIRIADWFGIENIVCSSDTVDVFNPKTVQATMGSFLRVHVIYSALPLFLNSAKMQHVPVFGAVLNGQNVYHKKNASQGIILMGSESHGISPELLTLIDEPVTIPSKLLAVHKSKNESNIDSLNVATATAILCALFADK